MLTKEPKATIKLNKSKVVIGLGFLAAIAYNSWPLGYILDPKLVTAGLASDLEGIGEPYNWLYTSLDILSALLVLVIIILVIKKGRLILASLAGLFTFSLMTMISALLPLNCHLHPGSCAYNQVFGWHNVTGGIADVGLFIAMLFVLLMSKKLTLFKWNKLALVSWSALGLVFLLLALPSVNTMPNIVTISVIWQDLYLLLSGILIVLLSYSYVGLETD